MSLTRYKQKRNFKSTTEPTAGKSKSGKLVFVVQQHKATQLHYDFRLEMDGVLKSWAVPKGPSTDPSVKRLAMQVEDHPYDYRNFEGIIPEGNYGAGTVIIWDKGTYEPVETLKGKKNQEKELIKQLKQGSLKIVLHGEKLKGEWALVHTKQAENSWLLMKHKDQYAAVSDITRKSKSVVSGKTLIQLSKTRGAESKKKSPDITLPQGARKSRFPKSFSPMLATLADPVDEQGWIYEIKWDGYRAITLKNGHIIKILSRNNKSYNEKYSVVFESLQNWDIQAILDGEIVVLDKNGLPDFGALQNWKGTNDGDLVYYLFDIMWWKGYDLTQVPLLERRKLLEKLVPGKNPILRLSERINSKPSLLLKSIAKMGLEGIMAKQADSLYTPGVRSKAWLKMKVNQRHEVVIGGFTQNEGTSKTFSSLLVGLYRRGHLHYTGKIGTGFSVNLQLEIMGKMKPLIRKSSPFAESIDINHPSRFNSAPPHAKVTWLKPVLVAEVSYREMTADGVMRHPSFEGLRDDKEAKDVHEEIKLRKQTQPIKKIKRKKS